MPFSGFRVIWAQERISSNIGRVASKKCTTVVFGPARHTFPKFSVRIDQSSILGRRQNDASAGNLLMCLPNADETRIKDQKSYTCLQIVFMIVMCIHNELPIFRAGRGDHIFVPDARCLIAACAQELRTPPNNTPKLLVKSAPARELFQCKHNSGRIPLMIAMTRHRLALPLDKIRTLKMSNYISVSPV